MPLFSPPDAALATDLLLDVAFAAADATLLRYATLLIERYADGVDI